MEVPSAGLSRTTTSLSSDGQERNPYARIQNASGALPPTLVTLDQFHVGFSREYAFTRRAAWARPFVIGSVGATNMLSGSNSGSVHLSVGFGAGIKLGLSRWDFECRGSGCRSFSIRKMRNFAMVHVVSGSAALCPSQAEVAIRPIFSSREPLMSSVQNK